MKEIITLLSCIAPIIENKTQKQLGIIIQALLSMRGRITMLGLSRWSEKGGSYRTIGRFFHNYGSGVEYTLLYTKTTLF
jgi:hypothetical protein